MRVAEISINRSEHQSVMRLVGAWEILVLQYEYGAEKIVVRGFKKIEGRQYPDAQQEFERLSIRYGTDVESGASKAALTYGQGAMGVANIRNLIAQEQKLEAAEDLEVADFERNVVSLPDEPGSQVAAPEAAREVLASKPTLGLPKQRGVA